MQVFFVRVPCKNQSCNLPSRTEKHLKFVPSQESYAGQGDLPKAPDPNSLAQGANADFYGLPMCLEGMTVAQAQLLNKGTSR